MIKLIEALALSRNATDANIAFGEAVPRLERLKTVVLVGLVGVSLILGSAYVRLSHEVNQIQNHQEQAHEVRSEILLLVKLMGQERANAPR